MSTFQKEFEKAVLEVASEIEAMDNATFQSMLADHRDGEIGQILAELDSPLEPEISGTQLYHGFFLPPAYASGKFDPSRTINLPREERNDAAVPEECLTAA